CVLKLLIYIHLISWPVLRLETNLISWIQNSRRLMQFCFFIFWFCKQFLIFYRYNVIDLIRVTSHKHSELNRQCSAQTILILFHSWRNAECKHHIACFIIFYVLLIKSGKAGIVKWMERCLYIRRHSSTAIIKFSRQRYILGGVPFSFFKWEIVAACCAEATHDKYTAILSVWIVKLLPHVRV